MSQNRVVAQFTCKTRQSKESLRQISYMRNDELHSGLSEDFVDKQSLNYVNNLVKLERSFVGKCGKFRGSKSLYKTE